MATGELRGEGRVPKPPSFWFLPLPQDQLHLHARPRRHLRILKKSVRRELVWLVSVTFCQSPNPYPGGLHLPNHHPTKPHFGNKMPLLASRTGRSISGTLLMTEEMALMSQATSHSPATGGNSGPEGCSVRELDSSPPSAPKVKGIPCRQCLRMIHSFRNCPARGFPRGAVVKNPPANAGNTGSSPGPGRSHMPRSKEARAPQLLSLRSRAHEPQLLSPRATTTEAHAPRARVPQQEKPPQ